MGNQLPANTGLQKLAVVCERDSLVGDRAGQGDLCVLRASLLVIAISMLFGASAALAAEPMAPNDIKATFFTGQPFTAAIALWREIQNDLYAGRKDDSRTTRTVR